ALEYRRFHAVAVPADAEAVAVGCCGAHAGMQALVDDGVLGLEEQLLGKDRVSGISHPSAHGLSEAPLNAAGITLHGGYRRPISRQKRAEVDLAAVQDLLTSGTMSHI